MSPADSRPDGGRAIGVFFSVTANKYLHEQPEHKYRDRDAGVGQHHRPHVRDRVAPVRSDHSEWNTDDHSKGQREDGQLDGGRKTLDEDLGNGPTLLDRRAEVALKEMTQVLAELHPDRLIEAFTVVGRGAHGVELARSPSGARHGSLEMTRERTNTDATMPNSTGIDESSRCRMNRITGGMFGSWQWVWAGAGRRGGRAEARPPHAVDVGLAQAAGGVGSRQTRLRNGPKPCPRPTWRGSEASHWTR